VSRLAALAGRPWIWSYVAALAVWGVTVAQSGGQGGGQLLTAALSFAAFTVLVSLGQMLVITTGPGNVDLSIPATIALSSAVSMLVMNESAAMIGPGLLAAVAVGMVIGAVNFGLIQLLRIPPIIATLASSFVVQSAAIWYGRGLLVKPPPLLEAFTFAKLAGLPLMALLAVPFTALMALVLRRTVYGRSVLAIGQNPRAAALAGIEVERTRALTYGLCGALAGFTGALFAGFSGGAALDMGAQFLLSSIAVVVIGGTSVAGGRANLPGLWGAAMFLFLLVSMLNTLGVSTGVRQVLTGVLIILVISLAGGREES
jgi:ribose transport system permease protein